MSQFWSGFWEWECCGSCLGSLLQPHCGLGLQHLKPWPGLESVLPSSSVTWWHLVWVLAESPSYSSTWSVPFQGPPAEWPGLFNMMAALWEKERDWGEERQNQRDKTETERESKTSNTTAHQFCYIPLVRNKTNIVRWTLWKSELQRMWIPERKDHWGLF